MAYTPDKLSAWILANPNYNAFAGTASGKPLLVQTAANGAALLKTAVSWEVWNFVPEWADLSQSAASQDYSRTGDTVRRMMAVVPDAPSPSELEVTLGEDTDVGLEAFDYLLEKQATAYEAGEKLYLCHFMGIGKRSEVYEATVSADGGNIGVFPDPITKMLSVTPNMGGFHDNKFIITNVGG